MTTNQDQRNSSTADMSPHAVEQRLRDLAQLYKLGVVIEELRRAGKFQQLIDAPAQTGTVPTNHDGVP